ncbi:hypothetical protein HFU84_12170 [Acidithiobacillus sp. CV18-2]|nr:hypothetical protein [Acidithiobacillus sp. CV18-3]MBU2756031.1 hypothetical protein [Acidithiobacillus sp. BN09-2]MBU2778242.1 hypothetical protein [Acidithiobacillus sp. CV18-2]MBU2799115.1 hypothetical protein [Acidithiobacillus sp. VAN18-4]
MTKAISTRIKSVAAGKAGAENKHDMRTGHHQPVRVDPERTRLNSVLIEPQRAPDLRRECIRRRHLRPGGVKRAMKRNAAVATIGVLTFSHEAQRELESLPANEQDKRFLASAKAVAEHLGTTLTGLVVHRDETAVHAHYQLHAVRLDGLPVSRTATRQKCSELQDVAVQAWADLGIERGEKKWEKKARLEAEGKSPGEVWRATNYRTVTQMWEDLPREIEAAKRRLAEAQHSAERNQRLLEAQKEKLEAGRVEVDKGLARMERYEQRVLAAEQRAKVAKAMLDAIGEQSKARLELIAALDGLDEHSITPPRPDGTHKIVNARTYLDEGIGRGLTQVDTTANLLVWVNPETQKRLTVRDDALAATLRAAQAVDSHVGRAIQSVEMPGNRRAKARDLLKTVQTQMQELE